MCLDTVHGLALIKMGCVPARARIVVSSCMQFPASPLIILPRSSTHVSRLSFKSTLLHVGAELGGGEAVGLENAWYRQDPVEDVGADTKINVFGRTHSEEQLAHLSAQRRSTGTARDRGGSGCLCAACGARGAMNKLCRDSRPPSKKPCNSSSALIV